MNPREHEKLRRRAQRLTGETLRILKKHSMRFTDDGRAVINAAVDAVHRAQKAGDPPRLQEAFKSLEALHHAHLGFAKKSLGREYAEVILVAIACAVLVRVLVGEPFKIPSTSMVPTLLVGDHIVVSKLHYGVRVPFTYHWLARFGNPKRGDVIVFVNPKEPSKDFVKRVIGLPGDSIELRDQVLYVNGIPQPRMAQGELTYEERNDATGRWWTDTCLRYSERLAQGAIKTPRPGSAAEVQSSWAVAVEGGVVHHDIVQCKKVRLGDREGPFETVKPGHLFVMGDNRDRSADSRSEGGWQVPLDHVKGKAVAIWWSWGRGGWSPGAGQDGVRLDRLFKRVK